MKSVERHHIVDFQTYEDTRDKFRQCVIKAKSLRRIHIGEYLTLLFENPLTVCYQIQEMMRAERIIKEANILHEIQTYNDLLGAEGGFGCTLLIEISDPELRKKKLSEWWLLPEKIYLLLEDKTHIYANLDENQREEGKVSSVQYLKFSTSGQVPIAAGVDLDDLKAETTFTDEQRNALKEDLEHKQDVELPFKG